MTYEPEDLDTGTGARGTWIRLHNLAESSVIESVRRLHARPLGSPYCAICRERYEDEGEVGYRMVEWPCPTAVAVGAIKEDPRWRTPAELRSRDDADGIECQEVVSGRWKSLADRYWDTCVIPVFWRRRRVTQ